MHTRQRCLLLRNAPCKVTTLTDIPLLVARCSLLVARHMQQILDEHGVVIVTGVLDGKERLELERVWCVPIPFTLHAATTTTDTNSIAATDTVASACSNS
jgi:hypothetical protein